MRVRKVVTRRGRHIRGYFPSKKLNRMVAWESLLEKDALLLVELSPGVLTYQEQPEEITYWNERVMCSYIPDLRVNLCDETSLLVEVKPVEELRRPSVRAKYQQIAQHLQEQGEPFQILTDLEIRREPQYGSLCRLLYWYNHAPAQLPSAKEIDQQLKNRDHAAIQDCLDIFGANITYALIARGQLVPDLSRALTPASLVQLPTGGRHAAIYF
ncbi:TnsA endonuclease N-terminal domain-containing protein [Laribacter hongkongensis]|uniref:TnsA endonuclease N-terminal domain-containing protein n=1 Tax=Laribacter hongkongensis TaxID=168471 RepID=UPI0013747287|nr:TnsA endonuclease N-terminal domain-containing protein [Laribacter hongkongensis]MCG9042108.1 Tn7 transposase TnsA N-terminal domain-containing protein [Laribacter hongkongensis]MCG9068548.1 Tn7 transposase TnsA N-terminal domain-containing protein [Laribacter hongkongensis]MCG9088036.1 Tn7 transposase TnsA N-terminal domain-containing protein [Laribacter hongkongensis]MCG9110598.1 Tn7 transposase TnsA N-terminal domain-containing protein [Laribacter hongkongensis]MCG9122323.1 Tn7 transposa